MGLRAGWLALFIFVWLIGAFLGSTFEYQDTAASSGMSYSTGSANFTQGSTIVTGAGTTWNQALMASGLIQANNDGIWYKIQSVNSTTNLTLTSVYAQAGGSGLAYTMQASPGWAGTGTGGYATGPATKLEFLTNVKNAVQTIEILGAIPLPVPNGEYFEAAFDVLVWRWSFMEDYQMFYWVFLAPFVLMGILSMILLVYGVLTGNLSLG